MKKRYLIIGLIILSGLFHYQVAGSTRFYPAQFGFFIFSVGLLGSYLIYKKNIWMGALAGLFALGFLKTFLFQDNVEYFHLYKEAIIGASIFLLYYVIREMDLKEDILKWFLIPVGLNIILIISQKFDGNILSFMPVGRMTGFLGNPSVTSTYIILSIPIFLKYYPKLFPFLVFACILCHSRVPFVAMVVSGLTYLWYVNRMKFKKMLAITLIGLIMFFSYFSIFNRNYFNNWTYWFKERGSQQVGTLDGIMHNSILGWGIGSFEPIMKQIPQEDSYYCGAHFNEKDYASGPNPEGRLRSYMNHPHNEYIYGWWNVGIMFPILLLCLLRDISKKFTRENVLPFSILVGGMVLGMGYFFCYPVWFFLILVLAVFHNQKEMLCPEADRKRKLRKRQ